MTWALAAKVGETFRHRGKFILHGVPVDLTNVTITCKARDRSGVVVTRFNVTKADQVTETGEYDIWKTHDDIDGTLTWPVDSLKADLLFEFEFGERIPSPSFSIVVQPSESAV